MSYSPTRKLLILPSILLLAGCGPKAPALPIRLAVLRFENLGADASTDWMGRAFSEIITAELPGAMVIPSVRLHALDRTLVARPVSAPGISTERSEAILAGATRIGYGDYSVRNGVIEARLTIEDPQTGKMTQVLVAKEAGIVQAATDLAHDLSSKTVPYQTNSPDAVKEYMKALEEPEQAATARDAEAAIAADPNFAQAYRLLADAKAKLNDREGALEVLSHARARGNAVPAVEQAKIALQAAELSNNLEQQQQALEELAKANPADPESWRALGQMAYARHAYPKAVEAYQRVLQLRPDDTSALNQLGYAQAFSADLEGALRTFARYQKVQPNDANPLDSTGDVQLMYGKLHEAEALYLQADRKDRKFLGGGDLFKAAMARLMTGDVPGASALAKQFVDARAAMQDPAVPAIESEWLWISGRRKQGRQQMESAAATREIASRAALDLAIWSLLEGDRAAAATWAVKAQSAATQGTAGDSIVVRFMALPHASAAEWTSRADQLFHSLRADIRDLALSYALLLDGHVADAAAPLDRVHNGASQEPGIPVLLAWSLTESGKADQAARLLGFDPIPQATGVGTYMPLWFPRLFDLRARVAEKAGRADVAAANRKMYQELVGSGGAGSSPQSR